MKKLSFCFLLLAIIGFTSCRVDIKYAAYNPAQNRFVRYVNHESAMGEYDYKTGDTALMNGEKVVIICH